MEAIFRGINGKASRKFGAAASRSGELVFAAIWQMAIAGIA